jgi:rare lipoprotein A
VGLASYYAHKFHGRQTANGEIFDMYGLSAAHRELPLGTVIRVTHIGNGRSLELRVNDRGPFIPGRILDLSLGAAQKLDMVEAGVAEIRIDIIKEP